jgi:transmembrane sensor
MTRSGNIVNFPERTSVDEEAARWIIRLDAGGVSAAEQQEFAVWKAASAQNAEAFERLKQHWGELDELSDLADTPAPLPVWARTVAWAGAGLAAAAALAAVLVAGNLPSRTAPTDPQLVQQPGVGVYKTAVGDQEKITLADGSVVTLNTASQIEARMNGQERTIRLLEGEAFFEVAHDASRPFRVYAGDGVTMAVGTAFSVRLEEHAVEVVVSEGKVSFARVADTVEPVAYVSAGEAASFSDSVMIAPVGTEEVGRKLAWTEGRLVFSGDPLSSVVADISRYTDIEFEFASEELADQRVGGVFVVGEVDDMLAALETNFPVRAVRIDDKHVQIVGRNP